jgi:hypothetical protein
MCSSGMRVATDYLKGRIVEANLADLNKDEDQNYRKIRLQLLVSLAVLSIFSGLGVKVVISPIYCSGCLRQALPEQLLWDGYDNR